MLTQDLNDAQKVEVIFQDVWGISMRLFVARVPAPTAAPVDEYSEQAGLRDLVLIFEIPPNLPFKRIEIFFFEFFAIQKSTSRYIGCFFVIRNTFFIVDVNFS